MFCANCGKDIPEGHDFCGNCGARAGQVLPKQTVTYALGTSTAAKKIDAKTVITIAAAIIIVVIAVIISAAIGKGGGVNRAELIAKEDIIGKWVFYGERDMPGMFNFEESGRLGDWRWEFVGDDIIKISSKRKNDEYIKVVFSKDKQQLLLIYYEDKGDEITDSSVVCHKWEN